MPIREASPPPAKSKPRQSSAASPRTAPQTSKAAGYEQGIRMLAGLGVMATGFTGQAADSITIAQYADDRNVRLLAENAERNVYFGKVLDMLSGTGGPILETAVLLMPLGLQILCNHGVIQPNPAMGIMPKEVKLAEAQQAAIAAQAEADRLVMEAMASAQAQQSPNGVPTG